MSKASNVLDRWINAASRTLTSFVTEEMNAYRLYTVVPVLVKFINNLTNIYVRYNRRRLKGSKGTEDTLMALVSLYDVLLTVCKVGLSKLLLLEARTCTPMLCLSTDDHAHTCLAMMCRLYESRTISQVIKTQEAVMTVCCTSKTVSMIASPARRKHNIAAVTSSASLTHD